MGLRRTPRKGPKERAEENAGAREAARAEEALKRLKGEGYPMVKSGKECITLESLTRQLSECRRSCDETAALLPELVRERNRLLAAENPTELRKWEQERGRIATRNYRSNEHKRLRDAQALLEDFLYFQNPTHRRLRYATLQADYSPPKTKNEGRRIPYLFIHDHDQRRRDFLDTFDAHGIGGPLHRQGLIDWEGRPILGKESSYGPRLVRPNELHLWTPACRRRPVGFGVTANGPIEPTKLQMDEDAISEVFKRIGESARPDTEGIQIQSHAQRGRQQLQVDEDARTATANGLFQRTPEGKVCLDPFRHKRTREGVFISALESSYDWPTSYDSLGSVSDSIHPDFTISAEREAIGGPDGDSAQARGGAPTPGEPSEAASEQEPSKKSKIVHKTGFSRRKKLRKCTIRPQEPQIRIMIDYPYPMREFEDTSRERWPRVITERDDAPVSTAGRQEGYGRYEWHVNMSLPPASPVDEHPTPTTPLSQRPIPASPMDQQPDGKRLAYEGKGKGRAESGVEYYSPEQDDVERD